MVSVPYSRSYFFFNFLLPELTISKFCYGTNYSNIPKIKSIDLRIFFRKYKNDINIYLRKLILYLFVIFSCNKTIKVRSGKKFIMLLISINTFFLYYTLDYILYIGTSRMKSLVEKYKINFTKQAKISLRNFSFFTDNLLYPDDYDVSFFFTNFSFIINFKNNLQCNTLSHFVCLNNVF
jgi:hypothetical protein